MGTKMSRSILNIDNLKCDNICIINDTFIGGYLKKRLEGLYTVELQNVVYTNIFTKEYLNNFDVIICSCKNTNDIRYLTQNMNENQVLVFLSSVNVYWDELESSDTMIKLEDIIHDSKKNAIVLRTGSILETVEFNNVISGIFYQAMSTGVISYYNTNYMFNILGINDLYRAICSVLGSLKPVFEMYDLVSYNASVQDIIAKLNEANVKSRLVVDEEDDNPPLKSVIKSDLFKARYNFEFVDKLDIGYSFIHKCLACNSDVTSVLNLGMQVLVNDYLDAHQVCDSAFPVHLQRCVRCFHLQLNISVDPERLFRYYTYKSGVSNTMNEYFNEFAKKLPEHTSSVLEIASNDSSQLKAIRDTFRESDLVLVGVEPATNLVTQEKGISIINEFFGSEKCMNDLEMYPKFQVIIAQNVFAHIPDPFTFLLNCKKVLEPGGTIFIQTSQSNMILNNEFDTLYHEHISFFNTYSMKSLCERAGLVLYDVEKVAVHGSSYLFKVCLPSDNPTIVKESVYDLLDAEMKSGIYSVKTYNVYSKKILLEKNRITDKLEMYNKSGKKVIGYGSTAKINVVLNAIKITNKFINCIIDENPLKIGKYTSFGDIPIVSPTILQEIDHNNTIILILAWNFKDEIIKKIPSRFTIDLL